MDFLEELEKAADEQLESRINVNLASDGLLIGAGIGIEVVINALRGLIVWQANFEGYIDLESKVIDGHLANWEGVELKPTCRLIAFRGREE